MRILAITALLSSLIPIPSHASQLKERCSDPDHVLESTTIEHDGRNGGKEFHVTSAAVNFSKSETISGECSVYLSGAQGSAYEFSTGVYIRPGHNGGYTGLKVRASRYEKLREDERSIAPGKELLMERVVSTSANGYATVVGLVRAGNKNQIVLLRKDGINKRITQIETLLETEKDILSIDWTGGYHSNRGTIYALTRLNNPTNISFNLSLEDPSIRD